MRAAWRLDAKTGMAKLKKLAEWLEPEYPDAAASLLEGLDECFTINRLEIPTSLHHDLWILDAILNGSKSITRREVAL